MNTTYTPIPWREHTTLSSIDSSLLALALLLTLIVIVYNRYFHPLSPFPGPFLASIWSGWRAWGDYGNLEDQDPLLHERYGPIIRVSPNVISVADPEYLKQIYTQTHRTGCWLSFAHNGTVYGSSIRSSALHEELGKRAKTLYSADVTGGWEGVVDRKVSEWIGKLKGECSGGWVRFNLSESARALACDLLTGNVWMAKGDKVGPAAVRAKAGSIIDVAWKARKEVEACGEECYLSRERTTQEVNLFGESTTLTINRAISIKKPNRTRLTKEEVYFPCTPPPSPQAALAKANTPTGLAGEDSTAFAITSALKLLLTNPRVLAALLSELTTYYEKKALPHIPPWGDIAHFDTKLPYLSAVLRESLRFHPTFPMSILCVAPPSGVTITHSNRLYTIPGGCTIRANPIVIGRNKLVFGEDAHCFRPERWLEGSEEGIEMMKAVELEWDTDSGDCLGTALARMAVAKAIVMVLRNFEVGLVGGRPRGEAWKLAATGVHHATELWVKLEPREDKMDGNRRAGEMGGASELS
ncbi:unnamed protein product [Tuber aestivum]|uniref:Cytochrome P450 n=1 Tax=Tuber aestivum TaxID=59557 RepID=A0A292PJD8_9PEZI|nr:unnamed protein product [Tuber aestivum]